MCHFLEKYHASNAKRTEKNIRTLKVIILIFFVEHKMFPHLEYSFLLFVDNSFSSPCLLKQTLSRKLVHILSGLLFMVSWPIFRYNFYPQQSHSSAFLDFDILNTNSPGYFDPRIAPQLRLATLLLWFLL